MAYTPQKQGPQKPEKYPFVGQSYQYYGEQPGFIYDPYRDAYMPDKNAAQSYYQGAGLIPPPLPGGEVKTGPDGKTYQLQNGQWVDISPKKPGMFEQIAPLGAAALSVEGGKQIASGIFGGGGAGAGAGSGKGVLGGLLGGGTPAQPTAATQAPGSGLLTGTSSGGGLAGASGPTDLAGTLGAEQAASGSTLGSTAAGMWGSGGSTVGGQGLLGMTGASPLLGSAGIAAGAYTGYQQGKGLWDAAHGKDLSFMQQAALALPTFGASFLYNPIKNAFGWGDQDKWKTEGDRLRKLQKNGTTIPQGYLDALPTHGRSFDSMQRKDKPADFIGMDESGQWVNNKFNQSRNVADLRNYDIIGYSAFAEKDPNWFNRPLEERLAIADQALQQGAVKEHHGTIDLADTFEVKSPSLAPKPAQSLQTPGPIPKGGQGSPGMRPPKRTEPKRRAPLQR